MVRHRARSIPRRRGRRRLGKTTAGVEQQELLGKAFGRVFKRAFNRVSRYFHGFVGFSRGCIYQEFTTKSSQLVFGGVFSCML